MRVDYEVLRRALTDATAAAFASVRARTASEHLYVFGLYTSGEAAYFVATANTEEGLARTARTKNTPMESLRWSPCDWEYHGAEESLFKPVAETLATAWNEDFSEYSVEPQAAFEVALEVLEQLSIHGLFGSGVERAKLTINLFKGDQSEPERAEWSRRLNGPNGG